ncbi:MAG: hypothetical protein WAL95_04910 [Candidatus Acidiferrales bacterium]
MRKIRTLYTPKLPERLAEAKAALKRAQEDLSAAYNRLDGSTAAQENYEKLLSVVRTKKAKFLSVRNMTISKLGVGKWKQVNERTSANRDSV